MEFIKANWKVILAAAGVSYVGGKLLDKAIAKTTELVASRKAA